MGDDTRKVERRQNVRLRSVFDEAYERIAPFLDPKQSWGGVPLERLAFRVLRDNYPELTSAEARILVAASVRVYSAHNPEKSAHLPRADEMDLPA